MIRSEERKCALVIDCRQSALGECDDIGESRLGSGTGLLSRASWGAEYDNIAWHICASECSFLRTLFAISQLQRQVAPLTPVQNVARDVDSKAELIRLLIVHAYKIANVTPREQVFPPRLHDNVRPPRRTIQSTLGVVRIASLLRLSVHSQAPYADYIAENDAYAIATHGRIAQQGGARRREISSTATGELHFRRIGGNYA